MPPSSAVPIWRCGVQCLARLPCKALQHRHASAAHPATSMHPNTEFAALTRTPASQSAAPRQATAPAGSPERGGGGRRMPWLCWSQLANICRLQAGNIRVSLLQAASPERGTQLHTGDGLHSSWPPVRSWATSTHSLAFSGVDSGIKGQTVCQTHCMGAGNAASRTCATSTHSLAFSTTGVENSAIFEANCSKFTGASKPVGLQLQQRWLSPSTHAQTCTVSCSRANRARVPA